MKLADLRKVFMDPRPPREEPATPPSARPWKIPEGVKLRISGMTDRNRPEGCLTCGAIAGHFLRCETMERNLPHPSTPGKSEAERHELFLARKNEMALAHRSEIDYNFRALGDSWRGRRLTRGVEKVMAGEVEALLHHIAEAVPALDELRNVRATVTWSATREEFSVHFKGTSQDSDALVKDFFEGRPLFKEIER